MVRFVASRGGRQKDWGITYAAEAVLAVAWRPVVVTAFRTFIVASASVLLTSIGSSGKVEPRGSCHGLCCVCVLEGRQGMARQGKAGRQIVGS